MKLQTVSALFSVISLAACAPEVQFSEGAAQLASSEFPTHLKSVTQNFEVKENADIDVLFVVDNSGSMDAEQKNFSSKINGFMNLIQGMNWHVALTTTDSRVNTLASDKSSRAWGDGQFRPFDSDSGSQFVLKADEISLTEAQTKLSKALNVGLLGDGEERAIYASYRAV
ncbi:MAG: hypothetical protein J7501_16210, partial [Bdellovibrio sp.]|nr:hypothetical protein [Bdellovibrio sp.]